MRKNKENPSRRVWMKPWQRQTPIHTELQLYAKSDEIRLKILVLMFLTNRQTTKITNFLRAQTWIVSPLLHDMNLPFMMACSEATSSCHWLRTWSIASCLVFSDTVATALMVSISARAWDSWACRELSSAWAPSSAVVCLLSSSGGDEWSTAWMMLEVASKNYRAVRFEAGVMLVYGFLSLTFSENLFFSVTDVWHL